METITIEFYWNDEWKKRSLRPKLSVNKFGMLSTIATVTSKQLTLPEAARVLRTGKAADPSSDSPELVASDQEGVRLEHSNGLCVLDHITHQKYGDILLRSEDMADYFDAVDQAMQSDAYKDPAASFPDIDVPIIDASDDANSTYLRMGGERRYRTRKPEENEYLVHVSRIVDGEVMWVNEKTGEVIRPTGIMVDQEPKAEPANALDEVVAILGLSLIHI